LYGRKEVGFFNRSIEPSLVVKATALTIISLIIVTISIFIIMAVEPNFSFLQLSFEVLSAFGTVGLSMGITSSLSALGKIVITAVMFVGRIGPLTLVLALAERSNKHPDVSYPRGKIMIG
jgi:trk system potassium uptake protein TrkH